MRKRQREWREKKRKNWSEQQTQNCTLSRSKAFALTYQCISQRWSMWFVDNLSKIIFSEDNLLCEKIYQMLIPVYIDRVQNMQSLVLSRQVRFAVEALWYLVSSLMPPLVLSEQKHNFLAWIPVVLNNSQISCVSPALAFAVSAIRLITMHCNVLF